MSQSCTIVSAVITIDIKRAVRDVVRREMNGFLENLLSELEALRLDSNHEGAKESGVPKKDDHGDSNLIRRLKRL